MCGRQNRFRIGDGIWHRILAGERVHFSVFRAGAVCNLKIEMCKKQNPTGLRWVQPLCLPNVL